MVNKGYKKGVIFYASCFALRELNLEAFTTLMKKKGVRKRKSCIVLQSMLALSSVIKCF